eukprot:m.406789 g.406789  ORF g.406789 m.406789 type:complete len:135 (-) comp28437_c0_seq27:5419-5823(-)
MPSRSEQGGTAGKRRRVSASAGSRARATVSEGGLPEHYLAIFRTFCRLDTGYCVLKNRLRHIGLATLVSIAQDTDEGDVLRLVAAAPTVYELYWRQDAESTQQRGRYGKCARNCELAWCTICLLRGERGYHAAL